MTVVQTEEPIKNDNVDTPIDTESPIPLVQHPWLDEQGQLTLPQEQLDSLQKHDTKLISDFHQQKLRKEASRNWDLFYKRNTTKFFKDRHWLEREFAELRPSTTSLDNSHTVSPSKRLLEIGCGVGNFIFPLMEANKEFYMYGCDFSKRAIDMVQSNTQYDESRCKAFVCDITQQSLIEHIEPESLDLISAIFVLSAIPPEKLHDAVANLKSVLKPGGIILFRDYALYDTAMIRFKPGHKMDSNFYVRQDGTFSYYFSTEKIHQVFHNDLGFDILENNYIHKRVVNRKKELNMDRLFVQGRFKK